MWSNGWESSGSLLPLNPVFYLKTHKLTVLLKILQCLSLAVLSICFSVAPNGAITLPMSSVDIRIQKSLSSSPSWTQNEFVWHALWKGYIWTQKSQENFSFWAIKITLLSWHRPKNKL